MAEGQRFPGAVPPAIAAWDDSRRGQRPDVVRTLAVKPWDDEPPPTAIQFYATEAANIVVPAGTAVATTLAGGGALQLPLQNWAALKAVVVTLIAPTLATNVITVVRANGLGLRGLSIKIPPQVWAALNWPVEGTWIIPQGATLDALFINNGAGAETVNISLSGWYDTTDNIEAWTGKTPGQL